MKRTLLLVGFALTFLSLIPTQSRAQYCIPTYSTGCSLGDSIYYFQLGSYIRNSGCSNQVHMSKTYKGYDSTGQVIPLLRGKRYTIRVLVGNSTQDFSVWVDFNNDGKFDTVENVITDNNGTDSLLNYIDIPANAKLAKIAFRVSTAYSTAAFGSPCLTTLGRGETEDYILDIKATKTDASVKAVLSPAAACSGTTQKMKIVVRNAGRDSLTIIPIAFKINGTTYLDTLKKTLQMDEVDTFTFSPTLSLSAGTYAYSAYTSLASDSDRTNDTINNTVNIAALPNTPTGTGATLCKSGKATISAASTTSGTKISWFASATSDTLLATTDTFTTPKVTTPTKFYAEAQKYFADSISTDTPTYGTLRSNHGCMFDIDIKSTLYVDSFYVKTLSNGKARVELYYKQGSYKGHETKSKDWTFVGYDTVNGVATTVVPCFIHIPKPLLAGQTYGIYIRTTTDNTNYDVGSKTFAKKDMVLRTGSSVSGLFGTPQKLSQSVVPTRNWNGNIFYHLATCPSSRVAVDVKFSTLKAGFKSVSSCSGTQFTDTSVTGSGSTITTWLWDFGDTTTSTLQNPKHNYKYGGKKIVKLYAGLGGGCIDSAITTITVNPTPGASFTFTNTCEGDSVRFTNTSGPTGSALTYIWDFGDKSSTSTATNPSHKYATATTYTVKLVATLSGCTDTSKVTITINPKPSKVDFGYTPACNKSIVSFHDSSFVFGGGTYAWSFGDGVKSSLSNPKHTYPSMSSYTVKLKLTSTKGCSDSISHAITFLTGARANFSYLDTCSANPTNFTNSNVTIGSKYIWDFGDGGKASVKDTAHTYSKGGAYTVFLISVNSNGCNDTLMRTINILQSPDASFTFTKSGFQKFKFVPTDTTLTNFVWNFGDSSNDKINIKPTHSYKGNIIHIVSLMAVGKNGCSSTSMDTTSVSTGVSEMSLNSYFVNVYPNPFKDATNISYNLDKSSNVQLSIYDMMGKTIAVLASESQIAGAHTLSFDPAKYHAKQGVYLMKIIIGSSMESKQLIYVK